MNKQYQCLFSQCKIWSREKLKHESCEKLRKTYCSGDPVISADALEQKGGRI